MVVITFWLNRPAFDAIADEFITALHERWPQALIQFEDFSNDHAFTLLSRYRHQLLCFNDDIQGTGAVALAGILGALRLTGESLSQQQIVIVGSGSAARGIADQIVTAIMEETNADIEAARNHIWLVDSKGLVTRDRVETLSHHKQAFARMHSPLSELLSIIKAAQP